MIKAVIFDFGGVIKKSDRSGFENIAKAYNVSEKKLSEKLELALGPFRKGLINEDKFWEKLSKFLNKPVPKNKHKLWRESYLKNFKTYQSVLELKKILKEKNIKTAILSNTIPPHTEIIREKNQFKGFDIIVLSYKVGLKKPEPEIYLLTTKKLKVKPEECIFIDDKEKHIKTAKELGIKAILFTSPEEVTKKVLQIVEKENN